MGLAGYPGAMPATSRRRVDGVAAGVAVAAGAVVIWGAGSVLWAAVAVIVAFVGVRIAWGSADPATQIHGPVELRGTHSNTVALTFDDGPDPDSTPALLAALREHGARATFFLLVDRAERYPELCRAIAQEHEIGLHGLSHHPWLTVTPSRWGSEQLDRGRRRLQALSGATVTRFRPPFGATSPHLAASARRAGLIVTWASQRTRDGSGMDPSALRARCQAVRGGDIVLMHEGPRGAERALPGILDDLAARGLRSVAVCDLEGL